MTTQAELGNRLREARLASGLSQEVAAARLDVPRPAVSQIEAGKRTVSGLELATLARLYRRPLSSFFEERSDDLGDDSLTILFRANALRSEDRRVVAEFERLCRDYSRLEALLELDDDTSLPHYGGLTGPRGKLEAIRQGEQVAAEERRRLGIGDDPIRDIFTLIDNQGVRLVVRPLPGSGLSGLFLYDRVLGPCILVNGAERRNRLAFNAAHEYAHVLIDRGLQARVSPAAGLEQASEFLEARANSFAAAFLLPSAGVEHFLRAQGRSRRERQALDVVDILSVQRAFGVSYQAALYRLQNLGWLDKGGREDLARHQPERLARALGFPDDASAAVGGDIGPYPLRYVALALEAYRRSKISGDRLAELLGKTAEEVGALLRTLGLAGDDAVGRV